MSKSNRAGLIHVSIAVILASGPLAVAAAEANPAGHELVVKLANMKFGTIPAVTVGDSIIFVNQDSVPHTVTARDHSFDLRIGPGQRARLNLTKAGAFPIYCILHSPMRATINVAAK
jgi:plastocyanin